MPVSTAGGPAAGRGERRSVPIPDGLHGLRVDQAVTRMFGLSRTSAAAIVEAGDVRIDGTPLSKSDKVTAGAWLDVTLPRPPGAGAAITPIAVAGLVIVYSDDDIVVVDKPVGVATHPSPG